MGSSPIGITKNNEIMSIELKKNYIKSSSIKKALLILKEEGWLVVKLGKIHAGEIVEKTFDLRKIKM